VLLLIKRQFKLFSIALFVKTPSHKALPAKAQKNPFKTYQLNLSNGSNFVNNYAVCETYES